MEKPPYWMTSPLFIIGNEDFNRPETKDIGGP